MNSKPKIVIAGAGSIGCYIGGLLQHSGHDVSFLGRQYIAEELSQFGLTLTDYSDSSINISGEDINLQTDPEMLTDADIVLVCVKSATTLDIAKQIKSHSPKSAIIVSLQNGIQNGEILRSALPGYDVRKGMVPFNVIQMGEGRFHRGTSGSLVVEAGEPDIADLLSNEQLEVISSNAIADILWGKLLINLNNGLNALSGIPLLEQISNRAWRKLMATQISEGLAVLKAEGIKPNPPIPAPAWALPNILRLPNFLFKRVAKQMLSIDPQARSSMWEDLQKSRQTEIDELQGEIIQLGEKHGIPTPTNQTVQNAIKKAEKNGFGSPQLKPEQL